MAAEKLLVSHISSFLSREIEASIDMSDRRSAKPAQQEKDLKTRSLAAFALQLEVPGLPVEDLTTLITDGSKDNGIDALFVDEQNSQIILVQSKWHTNGTGGIGVGEIHKTLNGLRLITEQAFKRFNDKITPHVDALERVLDDPKVSFKVIFATTGNSDLSEDEQHVIGQAVRDMNDGHNEMLAIKHLKLGDFHDAVRRGGQASRIDTQVSLESWGSISEPYGAYYGLASGVELGKLYLEHGERLFDENLRKSLGATQVNISIMETIESSPEHFWYFNNGVTALCESVGKTGKHGNSRTSGDFKCSGISIVNGAQTVSTLGTFLKRHPGGLKNVQVWVRLISLEECPDDFARLVTRGTNTQNSIVNRDFIALDSNQIRIRDEMRLSLDKQYVIKRGEEPPKPDDGCAVNEAILALACANPDPSLAVLAKRNIGKLEDTSDQNYHRLFPKSITAETIWDRVRLLREIDDSLSQLKVVADGKRKAVAIQGNRLIAHVVMKRLGDEWTPGDSGLVGDSVADVHEKMFEYIKQEFPSNYITSLFQNKPRCRQIVENLP